MNLNFIQEKLDKRRALGTLRTLRRTDGAAADFSSNDYLGFARRSELWAPDDMLRYGSTGSRLLTGNDGLTEETEAIIAAFHQAEAGLIFNSGYDANIGLFSALSGKGDTVIYDENIHASVKDGARLGLGRHYGFRHNDAADLQAKLTRAEGRVYIAIETVYSMDGDRAALAEILAAVEENPSAYLIVDEAHATGVIGPRGEGLVQELGLQSRVFARLHTFGKGLGCQGAIVLGSSLLREYLINFSRSFIYTTALPLPDVLAVQRACHLLAAGDESLAKLQHNIRYFRALATGAGLAGLGANKDAIHTFTIPGNEAVKAAAQTLQNAGLDVRPIMSPTVPAGHEQLRVCLHAYNTEEEMDRLVDGLKGIAFKNTFSE